MKPTEKQYNYVKRIIYYLGEEKVLRHIEHFFPEVQLDNLTKEEAQKIITGLSNRLPRRQWGGDGMSMSWIQQQ